MHFWIDKRSQCAYTGRHRVPSSLSSGLGAGRARYCGRKGMAAPVHRFAAVDCPPRRPHRPHRPHRHQQSAASQSQRDANSRRAGSVCVDVGSVSAAGPSAATPTIASLAAARSVTPDTLLRTAALGLHHSPMMAPHLKFGMLVSFALATVFLAGAKYYFDRQQTQSEPSDDISLATLLGPERPMALVGAGAVAEAGAEAPPPYNIAVLMPAREVSPPAYSALS
ncbi:hypothetical protein ACJJTC_002955 [Scirpophaga incertulas]